MERSPEPCPGRVFPTLPSKPETTDGNATPRVAVSPCPQNPGAYPTW
ncbi:hypothetical protein D3OALGB2SA_5236 [Olavius algarvensis associated proteobacterium Delta 3]|nr:hypothetical protein D3OALGB2SA_5236 [Olavius algarvensis associated proteobacterium Delta 3]